LNPHIGNASLVGNPNCLHGEREAKARKKLAERLGGWEALMRFDEDLIEDLTKRQLEGTLTDADLAQALRAVA